MTRSGSPGRSARAAAGLIHADILNCRSNSVDNTTMAFNDRSNMLATTSHPGVRKCTIDVYVLAQYVPGNAALFIVFGDGGATGWYPGRNLFSTIDSLIVQHRIPPIVSISIAAGEHNAQGSERGREYDTVSGEHAKCVEREVWPLVEKNSGATLMKESTGRATMGVSSSDAATNTNAVAWFHLELYHWMLAYSPAMVNQQWPHDPSLRSGM